MNSRKIYTVFVAIDATKAVLSGTAFVFNFFGICISSTGDCLH